MNNSDLETIVINIAYDDIDKPNLSDLDFDPQWILDIKDNPTEYVKWTHVDNYLPNLLNTFKKNTTEYYYKTDSNFIYPIVLYTNDFFTKYDSIEFDLKLINHIKRKKAKIVFFYITEGDWGTHEYQFDWMNQLMIKYQLQSDDVIVVNSNLKSLDNYTQNLFTIIPYNFFLINLDFIPLNKSNPNDIKLFEKKYLKYINNNRSVHKTKHLLCLNGEPRINRVLMFGELQTNPKLKNTFITSLRNTTFNNPNQFYEDVLAISSSDSIIDFYKEYNSLQPYVYDKVVTSKWIHWHLSVNESAHMTTFVNIVTESLCNSESIFLTEKIYKPMYVCQPFILFGNPNSLKKLKEYGFKTFDRWWDESYDSETDLNIRLEKITKVLEEIITWDFDKCFKITNEMEEVLIHNYKKIMNNDEMFKLYTSIKTNTKNTKVSLI
jgi:hypothetical protein